MVYDVIIEGAGPTGLFLACELRLAELSVPVLEQLEDPHSPSERLHGSPDTWPLKPLSIETADIAPTLAALIKLKVKKGDEFDGKCLDLGAGLESSCE